MKKENFERIRLRDELFEKFGLSEDEREEIKKRASFIRSKSKLSGKKADCYCCICKDKNDETEYLSNHHIMKVEYLAILAYCYDLIDERLVTSKKHNRSHVEPFFKDGKELFIPHIALCNEHHEMLHELIGDNPFKRVYDLSLNEIDEVIDILKSYNESILTWCNSNDAKQIPNYKQDYLDIWNNTYVNMLSRLSEVLSSLDLSKYNEFQTDEQTYNDVEKRVEDISTLLGEEIETDSIEKERSLAAAISASNAQIDKKELRKWIDDILTYNYISYDEEKALLGDDSNDAEDEESYSYDELAN